MIRIGILPYSSEFCGDRLFDLSGGLNRDNSLQAWHDFRLACNADGWEVSTVDNYKDEFDVYLVLDTHPEKIALLGREKLRKSIIQFCESPDVSPEQYCESGLKNLAENCPVVFCFNKELCEKYGFVNRVWYVDLYPDRERRVNAVANRRGVCMIATNKYSRHPQSQLHRRIDFLKDLAKTPKLAAEFELYGRYWLNAVGYLRKFIPRSLETALKLPDKVLIRIESRMPANSVFKSFYRGVTKSKASVLSNSKFNFIMENMYWGGWLTEKIFDALQFGCIPIYFGSDEVDEIIPSGAFINGLKFGSPLSAVKYALSLDDIQVEKMIDCGQQWLNSADFEMRFARKKYIECIQDSIKKIVM